MLDPSRLLDSATRLYGDDMDRLWGEMVPVPEANIVTLSGGERLLDGRFEVAYTPGHASHHVCYRHDGTAFVGDVGGVRITSSAMVIPPTPPPDIDVEAWHDSIDVIRSWRPERLAMTHFGDSYDVEKQLGDVDAKLDQLSRLARDAGEEEFMRTLRAMIERDAGPEVAALYQQAAPAEQLYAGYERYWRKRASG
jgi:glyoxylase-like metal-dependent hydrolase (beta-lactamase superfamily II)